MGELGEILVDIIIYELLVCHSRCVLFAPALRFLVGVLIEVEGVFELIVAYVGFILDMSLLGRQRYWLKSLIHLCSF